MRTAPPTICRTVGAGHCGVVSVGPRLSGTKPGREQCLPLRGKQPHERVCLQTGGARCAPPSARPAALPLLQLCLLCAGAGFISPGHVSFDADFSFCSVGRGLAPSAELPKNACRGELCSPVPVCLARSSPGKCVAAASWRATNGRPYTRKKARMQFFDGLGGGKAPACKSAHKGASCVNLRAGHARPLRLYRLKNMP